MPVVPHTDLEWARPINFIAHTLYIHFSRFALSNIIAAVSLAHMGLNFYLLLSITYTLPPPITPGWP